MKLAIVGWRPWTVAQRYKSLIVNAKKLGHKVVGVVLEHHGDRSMTASLFRDLGVKLRSLSRFNPDAVFGECFWNDGENAARVWAGRADKQYFALDHSKIGGIPLKRYARDRPPNTMLTANEWHAHHLHKEYGVRAIPVGFPNFDVDYEIDVAEVREKLGVNNLPMIALFLNTVSQGPELEYERERLFSFLALAQERAWKVFMHINPNDQGRKRKFLDRGHPRRAFLKELQDKGGVFVSCFPGNYNDIMFKPCGPMALIRSADLVGGTYRKAFGAYVASRKFFWMGPETNFIQPYPNLVKVGSDCEDIIKAIEQGPEATVCEQDPIYMKRWFYKVDGQAWRRILDAVRA